MTLVMAAAVAIVFGSSVKLVMSRDLTRVVMGLLLVSNATNLFLMAMGLSRGTAPIRPIPRDALASDPLVQALTLTAIVIGLGTSALLLALLYRVARAEHTLDTNQLVAAERQTAEQDEARLNEPAEGAER